MKFISNKHLRGGESASFCLLPTRKRPYCGPGETPVYLNVYDLTAVNRCVFWAGVGVFHSGVEVHGVEYAFGSHDSPTTGVYEVEPRRCPGFKFRRSIFIGTTCLDPVQVSEFIEYHSGNYTGDTYHFVVKNCNHFCDEICYELTGNRIPRWVNRLAKIGSRCKCLFPKAPKASAVRHSQDFQGQERRKKKVGSKLSSFSVPDKKLSLQELFSSMEVENQYPLIEVKAVMN